MLNRFFRSVTFIPLAQKTLFFRHLQVMLAAGLPITTALNVLATEINNHKLRQAAQQVKELVEGGKQLSEALTIFPNIFPKQYVDMIAAGESAGRLENSLQSAAAEMLRVCNLNRQIRSAMVYPIVIFLAIGLTAIEVVFFILPKIMVMFSEAKVALPLSTRVLIALTNFSASYGWLVMLSALILTITGILLWRQNNWRHGGQKFILHLPGVGQLIKDVNLARVAGTFSSLLESGIPIVVALKTTALSQNNLLYSDALMYAGEAVTRGELLANALAKYPHLFPSLATEMIRVGEESGQLEKMLADIANHYTAELTDSLNNVIKIVEPLIILILGLAVAVVAMAVVMPMYSLAQSY